MSDLPVILGQVNHIVKSAARTILLQDNPAPYSVF